MQGSSCLGTISGPQTFWIVATPALPEARVLGIKVVGHNTQTNDHPLATAIGPLRNGPVLPHLEKEFREWSGGRDRKTDFPVWGPVHNMLFRNGILGIENVGGELDAVTGRRCTFA